MDTSEGFATTSSALQESLLAELDTDFSCLAREEKENSSDEIDLEFSENIKRLNEQIIALAPSMKDSTKYSSLCFIPLD